MEPKIINFTKTGKPTTHGTGTNYNRGCRCEPCVLFNRGRSERTRKRLAAEFEAGVKEPKHGQVSTYTNYGCRCELCSEAHAEALVKEYKSRVRRLKSGEVRHEDLEHGRKYTYTQWGCRCQPCTDAATESSKESMRQYQEKFKKGDYVPKVHGTSFAYEVGCRCEACVTEYRHARRERYKNQTPEQRAKTIARNTKWKEEQRELFESGEVEVEHGKIATYVTYRCRCEPCTEANKQYGRGYRARKKLA